MELRPRNPAVIPTGRFAPSTTGRAHPGTLLAALLCWLDLRSRNGRVILRLEDLDPERCRDEFRNGLVEDLAWFGLDWDAVVVQGGRRADHEAALDRLERAGRLYPSPTSRRDLQRLGRRGPDGGWAYDNRDRGRALPTGGWRACADVAIRCRLDDGRIDLRDASGLDLGMDVAADLGDPVVRRRDGAIAYHLASVVDDAVAGVTDVVRGRDLATSTAPQVALQRLLGLPHPTYRHHLLLLEEGAGGKLSKFHGAVAVPELRKHLRAEALCGTLALACGLRADPGPCRPQDLLAGFAWEPVRRADVTLRWDGAGLHLGPGRA